MSLQTRLSSLISGIGADIKNHNTRIAALEAQGGRILGVQKSTGGVNAYATIAAGSYLQAASGIDLAISVTPSVPAWWECYANVGILWKTDAAYHYGYIALMLDKVDQDGNQVAYQQFTQHSTVDVYGYRAPRRIWKLAANTSYQCRVYFTSSGGSWQYHQLNQYLFLEGKYWAQ